MLELLVQNVTKYQQLCQGTRGHRKTPFKGLGDEQDPSSLLLWVSSDLRSQGRLQPGSVQSRKGVHGRNSHGKERRKQMFRKLQKGT